MWACMSKFNRGGGVLLLLLVALALFSVHTVDCGGGGGGAEVQWQILTKLNFSSQIQLHPRLFLLVTVPWSGESRSLMKELADVVAIDDGRFGSLKLMVLYRNVERTLADALGATDGTTIFYYHNALSYKYRGRLRVETILSSMDYVVSLSPDELPLKSLTTSEELRDFLHSTDKAVFLLEFCGWTPKLLTMNKSLSESAWGKGYLGADFNRDSNGTLVAEQKDNRKGMEDDKLSCGIENGYGGISWMNQFTSVNDRPVNDEANSTFSAGDSCTLHGFKQFEVLLEKLITVAKEFFLPPERFRFAVVRERSLLPLLNIEEPGSWLMTVHFAGCPTCSKVLKEVDDLKNVLQAPVSPVLELEDDADGVEAALPSKRPTMLLFVDRSSNSTQVRRESHEALTVFRELAQHIEMSNQIRGQATLRPDKNSIETKQASWNTFKHPRLQPSPASQKLILKDKMSVVIMNEGQQVTLENLLPDLQGSSVHEILTYALERKKALKLSSLAKDAGFQLLSKDFEIEVIESPSSHSEDQSDHVLGEKPVEKSLESADIDKKQMAAVSSSRMQEEPPNPSDAEYILLEGKEDSLGKSGISSGEPECGHDSTGVATDSVERWNVGETRHSELEENEQQKKFTGSFFFLDGQYRLIETLTGGSKIPSLVIIDPTSQKHYVLAEQSAFSYSSLSVFVDDFLTGKLPPYLQSAAIDTSSRDAQRPPFVNLDFHETDSIPLVTAHTFNELVHGNKSDPKNSGHSWDRNILVLFSNNWCGFCQRMELVVREVYRAVKSYANMKINSSRKEKSMMTGEYAEDAILKLPLIYMMDCTKNDCSLIIKPKLQREVYPLLLLFPAERKNNTVWYEGDIAVSDIIKFLAAHGSPVLDLIIDKSVLPDQDSIKHSPQIRTLHHEVLLKDTSQNLEAKYQINPQLHLASSHERPQLLTGCVLTATEKLLDVHPFDESKILLIKADQSTGFQGLIINKQISWDSLEDLEEGFELLKEAPLSFGGPFMIRGMPLVALTRKFIEGQSIEVIPNIYFVDPLGTRSVVEEIRAGNQSVGDYWFFVGYSRWGWELLFNEIAQGAWNVSKDNLEQVEWPKR